MTQTLCKIKITWRFDRGARGCDHLFMHLHDLATPFVKIDAQRVGRNLKRVTDYAAKHDLSVRPHTKTHKSRRLARMQLDAGATGLTVAKVGEAEVLAALTDDLLLAYPAISSQRCERLAELARGDKAVRLAIDSAFAADIAGQAAQHVGVTLGILVDLDVGLHRTGVQGADQALELAQHVDQTPGLRLDGLFFYPGHVLGNLEQQQQGLSDVTQQLTATIDLWKQHGLAATIVSGGSTPTLYLSHHIPPLTEIRPGTYPFNDMNTAGGGYCELNDCAATIITTVISDAVPGQVVIDAGSKALTSDRNIACPDSGHGHIVEYPAAVIKALSEEHGCVDVSACDKHPRVGDRLAVIPNHICTCMNLIEQAWWTEDGESAESFPIDTRGMTW